MVLTDDDGFVAGHGSKVTDDGGILDMECNVAPVELGLRSGDSCVLAGASETLQADLVSSFDSSRLGARDWWCGRGARCSRGSATGPQD